MVYKTISICNFIGTVFLAITVVVWFRALLIRVKLKKYNKMEWIKITTMLPPFGKQVLFRGMVTWKSKKQVDFFDDELTMDEETLEYGQSAYILKEHCDWLVSQHPNINEVCDQFITHWCEIPAEFS